ncbi:ABC transporter substrate-binding protein [Paractinoplanes atraurantiacus]|uniref:NitT/TauT family transport system substrate-binding protein n=1 Tax=Paractinoplanes atraurantiacus TaxID=1036182 RepID=A0A285GKY5_9ACTN|nr:ABC transporter substrate-binding protein [Actinoplanes atraurantiacus]SNY24237.1 NitT/TauT family transport system substrate-binding protein [Actinoplanes atraurantiacus]
MSYVRRFVALLLLAVLPGIAGCGGSGESTAVSYGGVRDQGSTGYAVAELEGFYAGEGLTFSPTWATSGTVLLQGLVSGDFDVANLGPAQLYDAITNGACARVLRPTQGAGYGVIAQPALHLDTTRPFPGVLTQLRGRTVGVPARGAAQELVLRSLLVDAGLDPDTDVTWVAIGGGAAAASLFASRKVDVAMSYSLLEMNLAAGGTTFDKLVDLTGSNTPLGAFWQSVAVANCDWADRHPGTVMKFCHALNQGFEALERKPEAGPRAFTWLGLGSDPGRAKSLWDKYKSPVVDIPPLDEENWNHQARFATDGRPPGFSEHVVDGCATA